MSTSPIPTRKLSIRSESFSKKGRETDSSKNGKFLWHLRVLREDRGRLGAFFCISPRPRDERLSNCSLPGKGNKTMIRFCGLLGLLIEETACAASGNHPACQKCRAENAEPVPALSNGERKPPRRRCACGRAFIPGSNRQGSCPRCSEQKEKEHNRARCRRYYQKKILKKSGSHGLEAKFGNQIAVF
jgi:hypothetical protein